MSVEPIYYYPEEGFKLQSLSFKGYIRGVEHPRKNSSYNFYIILLIETEYHEFLKVNCFRNRITNLYSPRKNKDLSLKSVAPNQLVHFTLKASASRFYNIESAELLNISYE